MKKIIFIIMSLIFSQGCKEKDTSGAFCTELRENCYFFDFESKEIIGLDSNLHPNLFSLSLEKVSEHTYHVSSGHSAFKMAEFQILNSNSIDMKNRINNMIVWKMFRTRN